MTLQFFHYHIDPDPLDFFSFHPFDLINIATSRGYGLH